MFRRRKWMLAGVIGAAASWIAVARVALDSAPAQDERVSPSTASSSPAPAPLHSVIVNARRERLGVELGEAGAAGMASCTTCHAGRAPNVANASGADLDEFHAGLAFRHGTNGCLACHDATNYDRFRLADGRPLAADQSMTLCAQCHATKVEEYAHGAHGGMNGHWDLKRGQRTRNHCIDCHDPHAPAFPRMQPTFKPRDRFLARKHHDATGAGATPENGSGR